MWRFLEQEPGGGAIPLVVVTVAAGAEGEPGGDAVQVRRRLLEDYGADGLYDDCGYVINANKRLLTPTADEVMAFQETPEYDGALTDLLALIYAEVKRRGDILKLHVDAAEAPRTAA